MSFTQSTSQPNVGQQTEHGFVRSVLLKVKAYKTTYCILNDVCRVISSYEPQFENFFFVWLGVNFVKMLEHGTRVRRRVISLKLVVAKEAISFLTLETKRGVVACWIIGVLGPSCDIFHCGQQPVECPSTLALLAHPLTPPTLVPTKQKQVGYVRYDVSCCQLYINHIGRSNGRRFSFLLRISSDRIQNAFLPTPRIPEPLIVSTNSLHSRTINCFYQLLTFPNHYLLLPTPHIPEPIIVSTNSSHSRTHNCFYQLLTFPNH